MSQMKRFVVMLACAGAIGCASGGLGVRPENIPALEQRTAAEPGNTDAATALGIAYYNAKRYEEARNTLTRVVADGSAPANAHLYLGLAHEELKDWGGAHSAYEKFLESGEPSDVRAQVRGRLAFVARNQLKQDAKTVLDREQQMSEEAPTARTVAVMPFRLVGINDELAPLQTALSDMIITDLSISPAISSIERVKINAMIDEMLLAQAGLAEENTGARVGRLLKAEHVVQGVLAQSGEREVRADANVLNTTRRASAGTFGQSEQVEKIFDLEKQIVFSIFDAVGVTLTPSEREKINENRTGNLFAFLAYGRGLDAMDQGNYQQASTFFRQASQLDPNFQRAQESQQEAQELQQASEAAPAEVASAQASGPETGGDLSKSVTDDINGNPGADLTASKAEPPPPTAGPIQNQTGNVNTSQGQTNSVGAAAKATIRLIIRRPGT